MLEATYIPALAVNETTSTSSQTPRALRPEDQFGEYRIVRRLGHGGMGTVYEADHLTSGRRVALKVLSHSLDSKEARSRFLREGRLAAAINHQNSVYVFGTEEIEGVPTISMELISGGTLASQITKFGPMSVQQAVDSILQVIDGLEAAEQKGVLHRDVKPANCFVDRHGQVKVGDFGLSISTAPTDLNAVSNMTQEGAFLGTPAFASPEQLRGEQLDQRSDIYAVGVTLFYLLTGRPPFEGKNMIQLLATVLDKSPPDLIELQPEVPPALAQVIESCLSKASGSRPSSYTELRERLLPFSSQSPIPATFGQRFFAALIDVFVLQLSVLISRALIGMFISPFEFRRTSIYVSIASGLIALAYFSFFESRYGRTPGKRVLGLEVTANGQRPRFSAALLRVLIYETTTWVPSFIGVIVVYVKYENQQPFSDQEFLKLLQLTGFLYYFGFVLTAALFLPMWKSRSKEAFHDRLTDTQVIVANNAVKLQPQVQAADDFASGDFKQTIGPYYILSTLNESQGQSTLLGYDSRLLRRVWIRTMPASTAAVSDTERNLSRPGRLRWLGGHRGEENWDCYEAPLGDGLTEHPERNWEQDRRLINNVACELERALEDGTLPARLSLQHLWVNEGEAKILPFPAPDVSDDSDDTSIAIGNSRDEQEAACVRFIAKLAEHVSKRHSEDDVSTVPLSSRPHFIGLWNAESLQQSRRITDQLLQGHATVSRTRRLCLLLLTFSLPIASIASSLVAGLILQPQYLQQPRVGELNRVVERLSNQIENRHSKPVAEQTELITAMKTYIAGEFRDVYDDPAQWNSPRATFEMMPENRTLVESLMAAPRPTAEEFEAAKESSKPYIGSYVVSHHGFLRGTLYHMDQWSLYFWIPSLFAAVFWRGGWLVRSLGVTFVDRHGERASKLRLLWRAFLPGLPFLIAFTCAWFEAYGGYFFSMSLSDYWTPLFAKRSNVAFSIVGCGLLIWTVRRKRFLSDTLSGCYLVPR